MTVSGVRGEDGREFTCPMCNQPVRLQLVTEDHADWFHTDGTPKCAWRYTP